MPDETRHALERALHHALEYLESLDSAPVGATADLATVRARLSKPLADRPMPAAQVIDELVADSKDAILNSAGGRFFAWVMGGSVPASLAADLLTTAWDQNAGIYASGPAAAVTEEVAGGWLKDLLRLPPEASFAFVTGCQMAHVTCLAAARHSVLQAKGWDVEEQGLFGAPPIRIVSGNQRHGSTTRAIRYLGLGRNCVVDIPADDQSRLRAADLEAVLQNEPDRPTIVLLLAGELCTGAYDNFAELIPIARKYHAWVHVDGAFGLWAAASPRLRHLTEGVELADSWATDGHKWLNVPYDSGFAFVKDPTAHRASMSHRESYLIQGGDARDQMDYGPEWSRRARGFATYAAIRELGRSGIAQIVEGCCDHARELVLGIGALPGAEVIWEPQINQGLLRFGDDANTDLVISKIVASGEAWFGGTIWRGKRCMRVSVSNWRTTTADVERVIAAFRKIL
jgi:glutamate/tyrosine decarboxylase-like PLP-dependent enzyme